MGLPAQAVESVAVHELSRGTIWLGGVKFNAPGIAHRVCNGLGYFCDGHVRPKAHVDVALHGAGVLLIGGFGQLHDVHAGGGHVVYIQELSAGRASTPDGDAGGLGQLGFVKTANQSGGDVAVLGVGAGDDDGGVIVAHAGIQGLGMAELPDDGAADHAAVACDVDFGGLAHAGELPGVAAC